MKTTKAFEVWWKRFWGTQGKFHEGLRKELALAAWNAAKAR